MHAAEAHHSCCLFSDQITGAGVRAEAMCSLRIVKHTLLAAFTVTVSAGLAKGHLNTANSSTCCPSAIHYRQETSFAEQEVLLSNWLDVIQ